MNVTILSRLRTIEKINYFLLHKVSSLRLERFQHSDFNNSLCLFSSKTMNTIGRISQKEIFLCPGETEACTRTIIRGMCRFSKKCRRDNNNYQACGCPGVYFDLDHGRFETSICEPKYALQLVKMEVMKKYQN